MNSQNVRQGLLVVIAVLAVVIVALLALPAGAVIWLLAPVLALSLILYLVLLVRSVRQAGSESPSSQLVRQSLLVAIGILLLITLMLLALPGHTVVWICVPLWGSSLALYLVLLVRNVHQVRAA